MTAIIDYDAGNIRSVEKALLALGEETTVTGKASEILEADRVILPGVGAFGDAMKKLWEYELVDVIRETVRKKTPFLGICLEGLGILEGEILRIPDNAGVKVPHIGWNSITYPNRGRLFEGIPENSYVYFVHSYYLKAADEEIVTAQTQYGALIHASVEKDNVFACQFHPEKSSEIGLAILRNFISINREE